MDELADIPLEKKEKLQVLDKCTVSVREETKMTAVDYDKLKESARKEFAKKNTAASRNQIVYCLKMTFENR